MCEVTYSCPSMSTWLARDFYARILAKPTSPASMPCINCFRLREISSKLECYHRHIQCRQACFRDLRWASQYSAAEVQFCDALLPCLGRQRRRSPHVAQRSKKSSLCTWPRSQV